MPTHECKPCKYKTQKLSDIKRHEATNKHLENVKHIGALENALKNATKKISCKFCGNEFRHMSSKSTHELHRCKKRPIKNKIKEESTDEESASEDSEKDKIIDELRQQNKYLMELAISNSRTANKSVSATAYVVRHFDKAPPMKKLSNRDAVKLLEYNVPENHTSGEMIVYSYESKTLTKYLGNIIVDEYKTKKPEDQSVWNSDSVRLSFIVRQALKSGGNEWVADKSGIKLMELIISPMLKSVDAIMKKYIKEKGVLIENIDDELDDAKILGHMTSASNIISLINKNELHDDILKYISPHFYLDESKMMTE